MSQGRRHDASLLEDLQSNLCAPSQKCQRDRGRDRDLAALSGNFAQPVISRGFQVLLLIRKDKIFTAPEDIMTIFDPDKHNQSPAHKEVFMACEIAYTVVDFLAAVLFVVGSILFFKEATTYVATWLFLIGSVFFGLRPSIKLYRELRYVALQKEQG